MGVGNLHIGENIGGAQIFPQSPGVQQFANIVATQKAKRDADNKYLNDTLASFDPTGLRNDADRQDAYKQYSDWKQQAIDAENERDPRKKAMAIAQVRDGIGRLNAFVGQSKKQGQLEQSIGLDLMKNRHNYSDDSIDKYKQSVQSGINSGSVITSPLDIERKVDPDKMDADYKKFKESVIAPTQWDNGKLVGTQNLPDGRSVYHTEQNRGVLMDGENGAFHNMLNYTSAHDDFKKGLQDRYPQLQGNSEAETNAMRVRQYMTDMGDSKGFQDKPKPGSYESPAPERPVRPSFDDIQYHNKYGTWPVKTDTSQPTPAQQLIQNMQTGQAGSGEKLLDLAPKGQYGTNKPHITIDPNTGEHVFSFPAHIDQKAVAENADKKAKWAKENPGEPYDENDGGKLKPETIAPAKVYKINPAGNDYAAQTAQMAAEQNINLDRLNKIEKGQQGNVKPAKQSQHTEQQQSGTKINFKTKDGRIFAIPFNRQREFRQQFPDAQIQQ